MLGRLLTSRTKGGKKSGSGRGKKSTSKFAQGWQSEEEIGMCPQKHFPRRILRIRSESVTRTLRLHSSLAGVTTSGPSSVTKMFTLYKFAPPTGRLNSRSSARKHNQGGFQCTIVCNRRRRRSQGPRPGPKRHSSCDEADRAAERTPTGKNFLHRSATFEELSRSQEL